MARRKVAVKQPRRVQRHASQSRIEARLDALVKRMAGVSNLKKATVRLKLTGAGGGELCLACSPEGVRIVNDAQGGEHDIEVIGDAARIQAMMEGKRDARALFLAGGVRVRGNIQYWSDVAYELGLIKERI